MIINVHLFTIHDDRVRYLRAANFQVGIEKQRQRVPVRLFPVQEGQAGERPGRILQFCCFNLQDVVEKNLLLARGAYREQAVLVMVTIHDQGSRAGIL
jgi:hypothetical protein